MFSSSSNKLQDSLFQLKFAAKQVEKLAAKAEKESEIQKAKVKKSLLTGNVDCAKVYAENAIRKRNESLNYLRMASRFDAVQSRVQTALTMNGVVKNLGSVTTDLEKAMKSMDLEKMEKIMSNFEKQFEDLDVRSATMEGSMSKAFSLSAPEEDVNKLIKQVADESGLEIADAMHQAPIGADSLASPGESSRTAEDEALSRRLAALRN